MAQRLVALSVLGLALVWVSPQQAQDKKGSAKPVIGKGLTSEQRQQLVRANGGNERSEQAVADGLRWLALHQAADGHWGLHNFNKHARQQPWPGGKVATDDSTPGTSRQNDVAGTALALLPFLVGGITHKAPARGKGEGYHRGVGAGLNWLMTKQSRLPRDRGYFGGDMYSHALATMALCEAYQRTADARLKGAAQAGIQYILAAQHDAGGWRYSPKQAGDLSVTGFQLRALKAGQRAGLVIPRAVFQKAEKFLDSCEGKRGEYSYLPGATVTHSMTAVGMLCRLYLGANPRNPGLLEGVKRLRTLPPGRGPLYYDYYATQAMFFLRGDHWKEWNLGPDGDGKGGIRDVLIARQDDGAKNKGNKGSWPGDESIGGRLGATAFSLLTLQVYYRFPERSAEP